MRTEMLRRGPKALMRAALPLVLLAAMAEPAAAQYNSDSLHGGTLEVAVNKSQVVTADQPIARAMVGNAEIADIVPLTDRSVYVLGKTMGTTSLPMCSSRSSFDSMRTNTMVVEAFRFSVPL